MTKKLIDTSFIVALVSETDEDHEKAVELSLQLAGKPLIVTDAVILEIGNSLSRRYKQLCIKTIENFFDSPEIEVMQFDETLFDKGFELYKSHADKTWGLVDCISFVVMREQGITDALTSDKHFVQAGFRTLLLDLEN